MADLDLITELKTYLITQGIGVARPPASGPAIAVPSIWTYPRDGAPQPRQLADGSSLENITVTLRDTLLAAPRGDGLDAYVEESFIDIIVRSRKPTAGKMVHRQIRGLLHPTGSLGGRKGWTMNDLLVERSAIWRGEQDAGATDIDYTRIASYVFQARRKALAGLPYTP